MAQGRRRAGGEAGAPDVDATVKVVSVAPTGAVSVVSNTLAELERRLAMSRS